MALSALDKLEIHEVLGRWAYGYDERDVALMTACFAAEAQMTRRINGGELIGPFEGRDAVVELMTSSMAEQTDVRRHVTSNMFFLEEDDQPLLVSNLTLLATENDNIQLLSAGVYRDRFAKEDGRWVILNRHLDLDRGY